MTAQIIDGEKIAARLREEIAQDVASFQAQYGYAPGGYIITCFDCKEKVWNCDKRAAICRPCAEKRHTANR